MARLEVVKVDAEAAGVIFQRLCDGEELRDVAKAWGVPKGRFLEWFTTQHGDLFDAALRVRAADLAIDAMNAALAATPEDVAVRKLQADVALKLAAKFDRLRFGETVRVEKSVTVGVDAGLLGTAGELLRIARERTIVGAEVLEGSPALLPASRPLVEHELI
jgi:AcrR family transcriptional regulator